MNASPKNSSQIIRIGSIILLELVLLLYCYYVEFSLIIPVLLFFMAMVLVLLRKAERRLFLNLSLLLVLISFCSFLSLNVDYFQISYIPVASIAMLTMLLYNDLLLAFVMTLTSGLLVGLIAGIDVSLMSVFILGGLTGVYAVKDARTRGELIKAGTLIGLIQALCIILLASSMEMIWETAFWKFQVWPFILNGFISAGIVLLGSKIFEWFFGEVTNFSLLELSDFNQPLLKRMVLECPGTYHHSLIVSNMSEAAATSIGANALLTRVGAYYHDIGKLVKPEYFNENQMIAGNKHEQLEPTMSRLVILNHVKEGIELAKKNKLSQKILDFIPQHHGTSLIYYFYQRAVEEAKHDEKVDELNFRYPGPRPQSREAAIVMLADSVEGAVRALSEPTASRIEEVVRKIINNKFIDGQLDECNLTLKDINIIGSVFTRSLSAIYHSRIQYPDKKNGKTNKSKKSSEKVSSKNQSDKDDDSQNSKESED